MSADNEMGTPHFGHFGLRPAGMCDGSFNTAWHEGHATVWDMGASDLRREKVGVILCGCELKIHAKVNRTSVTLLPKPRNRRSEV